MKSLEAIVAEACDKMTPAQHEEFTRRRRRLGDGGTMEAVVFLAESVAKDDTIGEFAPKIRRNNGGTYVQESREPFAEADRVLLDGIKARRPQAFAQLAEQTTAEGAQTQLSESQKKDYEFCKLLGMSEADALKVANSDAMRS